MYLDVNECAKSNGGCDSKRKCMNTAGSMSCGNCPAGYTNYGAKGCKGLGHHGSEIMRCYLFISAWYRLYVLLF